MLLIIIILLLILAFGGFGHTGYRRGWYGDRYYDGPRSGGWGGGGIGLILLLIVLFLLFARHRY
jgi:hypothetical protein